MTGERFHLGLIKTGDGEFHLCVEFSEEDPEDHRLVHGHKPMAGVQEELGG